MFGTCSRKHRAPAAIPGNAAEKSFRKEKIQIMLEFLFQNRIIRHIRRKRCRIFRRICKDPDLIGGNQSVWRFRLFPVRQDPHSRHWQSTGKRAGCPIENDNVAFPVNSVGKNCNSNWCFQLEPVSANPEGFQIPDFRCGGKHVLIKGDIPRVAFFPLVNHNPQ